MRSRMVVRRVMICGEDLRGGEGAGFCGGDGAGSVWGGEGGDVDIRF